MRIVYASDLHGDQSHYVELLRLARDERARAVVLGGDLLPSDHEPGRGLVLQRQFLRHALTPWLRQVRALPRAPAVYAMPGNEDCASTIDLFDNLAIEGLIRPLHRLAWRLDAGWWLAGMSLVPVTPFVPKDWDRLEGIGEEPPFPAIGGLSSRRGFLRPVSLASLQGLPTLWDELNRLAAQSDPSRTMYVIHCPPYGTALDRRCDGRLVGSRAVRAFIEQYQPPLMLHGHIHEAPSVSGSFAEWIGPTLCVNPGRRAAARRHVRYAQPAGNAVPYRLRRRARHTREGLWMSRFHWSGRRALGAPQRARGGVPACCRRRCCGGAP
jgi:Icc-related predicted phosphoesterase